MTSDNLSKVFVFGGPYGNLHATTEVLAIAQRKGYSRTEIICTGDVVGYCAHGPEVVDMIQESGITVVQGNVDLNAGSDKGDCGCNFNKGSQCDNLSNQWYPKVVNSLSSAQKEWLRHLPTTLEISLGQVKTIIVHGTRERNNDFIFKSTPWEVKKESFGNADSIIGGHCGIPFIDVEDKVWFNPGVVGMPANDGTTRGWYGELIAESKGIALSISSFTYNNQQESQDMITQGYPSEYAKTLVNGLWPNMDILPEEERQQQGHSLSNQNYLYEKPRG